MIYCVWYPAGGFGHFVSGVLNLYGKNFVRPKKKLEFSDNGNSHSIDQVAPIYFHDQEHYEFDFDQNKHYSVLIDNGIDNEGTNFLKFFDSAKIIKICYNDQSWPIIAHTMIVKAQQSSLTAELPLGDEWSCSEPWAQREKYFLFLRDHSLKKCWRPDNISTSLDINDLLSYQTMHNALLKIGIEVEPFETVWSDWFNANQKYIRPILQSRDMINGQWHDLTDVWEQAVFYYQIWCKYGVEVPHNDFLDFFQSQEQYSNWIEHQV